MKRHGFLFSLFVMLAMLVCGTASAQKSNRSYVVQKGGKKLEGRIVAYENGRLQIITQNGGSVTLNPGQYLYAITPKPDDVEKLENLLEDGSYNSLAAAAPEIFEKYKFLGWADRIAQCHCEALLALKRKDEAEKFLTMARRFPRENDFALDNVEIQLLVHDGKLEQAEKKLSGMLVMEDDATTAFVFMMRGRVEELSGRRKEAILQFLKAFLLFEDKKNVRRFRTAAKESALRLMKELGDPSAQILEGLR